MEKVDGRQKRVMVVALTYVQGFLYVIGLMTGSGFGRAIGGQRTGGSLERLKTSESFTHSNNSEFKRCSWMVLGELN